MGRNEDAVKKTKKSKELKLKKRNNNSELSENDGKLIIGEEEYAYTKSSLGKKRKGEKGDGVDVINAIKDNSVNNDGQKKQKKKKSKKKKMSKSEEENSASINEICQLGALTEIGADKLKGKSAKARNKEKKDCGSLKDREEPTRKSIEAHQDDAYVISSGDEDGTKGMKKWITEYHQSRPGLKVLQQIINEFITAHETKDEEEKEKEVELKTEGGFELVTHHKGRKKTTDPESGTTVGSVSQAAAEAKMSKKKKKEIGINFYRFQKREAKMNEILMLQTRFEQDRKRIQEKRAQRKFRPY